MVNNNFFIGGGKMDDAKGIKAIIDLQAMVGIRETEESAKKAWDSFSEADKRNTLAAHATFVENAEN
jgi:hypothetical protein